MFIGVTNEKGGEVSINVNYIVQYLGTSRGTTHLYLNQQERILEVQETPEEINTLIVLSAPVKFLLFTANPANGHTSKIGVPIENIQGVYEQQPDGHAILYFKDKSAPLSTMEPFEEIMRKLEYVTVEL